MSTKLKWAYRALRIQDAAEAVSSSAPRWVLELGAVLMGWLLIGGSPIVCLWAFVVAAAVLGAIFVTMVVAMVVIRLLGFAEEDLERWALA